MTTWTDSAKTTLEGHLARMQHTLVASGADPAEVTDDLRRHIDEEVVSQRIGVVTTEDVERILQRIGLPPAPFLERNIAKPPQPSPQLDGERPAVPDPDQMRQTPAPGIRPARKWHGWLFFFGVGLPTLTLLIELATHMCAGAFFDPIPDIWHVLMVASVPLVNFFVWRSVCRKRPGSMGLDVASAFSIGVATYFSLLYLPLAPIALFAIIVFGWGLLPLSPMFALISAWRLRVLMGKIEPHGRHSRWAGFAWGAGLAALTVGLVVFPPLLTRHWSYRVVDGDADESARALWWLRAVGNERTLLADSYGTVRWSRDNPFGFNVQGNPVPAEVARGIYYRVTGHAFNEFPPPQLNYVSRNWDVFGDFSWDGDQGGTAVGGRLRGLSLGQSRLDGLVDGDAGWAYTEWILEFKNVSEAAREARAQIVLPPGGVVSRVTLWVNGEEREAAFAGSGQVRAAYEKVVKVFRRDPILVTHSGKDRVLMQCFPVPPNGGTMKVRLGITAPLELENEATGILRWPVMTERNFGIPTATDHSIWLESSQALSASHPKVTQDHSKPGVFALRGLLKDDELQNASSLIRVPRSPDVRSTWVQDPHGADGQFVRQTLVGRKLQPPSRVIFVIDGSRQMAPVFPLLADALLRLPDGMETSVLLARDKVEEFSGPVRKVDAAFLQDLSGRLKGTRVAGGQDNMPALVQAWDLAAEWTNSVMIWIHGPQPVELEKSEALRQRLQWRRPGQGVITPVFYDVQVIPGVNRLAEGMGELTSTLALPRFGSIEEDLQRLFALWRGEARSLAWTRERLEAGAMPEAERGRKSSRHLARLWAEDEISRLVDRNHREEAAKMGARYQLVTPVTGAVVLETQQQFEEAGLKPVAAETVPSVPEPGTLALLAVAGVMVFGRRLWRRKLSRAR